MSSTDWPGGPCKSSPAGPGLGPGTITCQTRGPQPLSPRCPLPSRSSTVKWTGLVSRGALVWGGGGEGGKQRSHEGTLSSGLNPGRLGVTSWGVRGGRRSHMIEGGSGTSGEEPSIQAEGTASAQSLSPVGSSVPVPPGGQGVTLTDTAHRCPGSGALGTSLHPAAARAGGARQGWALPPGGGGRRGRAQASAGA